MELNGGGVARGGEGVKGRFVFDFVFINNLKKITTHQLVAIEILLDLIAFFVHGTSFFFVFFLSC